MRRHRKIRRWAALASIDAPLVIGLVWGGVAGAAEEHGSPRAAFDSAEVWIPDPVEALDAPERLQEPEGAARLRLVIGSGGSASATRRLWWSSSRFDATLAADRGAAKAEGALLARIGSFALGGGGLSLPDFGLAGEIAGLVRRTRSLGADGAAPRGRDDDAMPGSRSRTSTRAAIGAAADIDGGVIAWGDRARVVGGMRRRGDGRAIALEVRAASFDLRGVALRADARSTFVGSVGVRPALQGARASAEVGTAPPGAFARVGLDAGGRRLRAAARYQIESGRDRPATLDLEGAWSSPGAAARFRWRGWSAAAVPRSASAAAATPEDDGRAELDLRAGRGGAGAWTLRIGSRPRQADGTGGERYAVGAMVVARERGRTLRLTAGRRAVQSGDGWNGGRAVGAVIDLTARGAPTGGPPAGGGSYEGGRAAVTLTVEAVRADRGTGVYGPGLDVADGGSLRARTRSGVRAAARAWIRLGAWRVGAAVDDDDDGTSVDETTTRGARAPRANLWLAWSGGSSAP